MCVFFSFLFFDSTLLDCVLRDIQGTCCLSIPCIIFLRRREKKRKRENRTLLFGRRCVRYSLYYFLFNRHQLNCTLKKLYQTSHVFIDVCFFCFPEQVDWIPPSLFLLYCHASFPRLNLLSFRARMISHDGTMWWQVPKDIENGPIYKMLN